MTKMAHMASRRTANHLDVVRNRNQASGFVKQKSTVSTKAVLTAAKVTGSEMLTHSRAARSHTTFLEKVRKFKAMSNTQPKQYRGFAKTKQNKNNQKKTQLSSNKQVSGHRKHGRTVLGPSVL